MKPPMHAILFAVLLAGPALAQSAPDAGQPVDAGKPALLEADKQTKVREEVARKKLAEGMTAAPDIGAIVPPAVMLYALPADAVSAVPAVTAYRFFVAGDRIAIVEPSSRRVLQLIDK